MDSNSPEYHRDILKHKIEEKGFLERNGVDGSICIECFDCGIKWDIHFRRPTFTITVPVIPMTQESSEGHLHWNDDCEIIVLNKKTEVLNITSSAALTAFIRQLEQDTREATLKEVMEEIHRIPETEKEEYELCDVCKGIEAEWAKFGHSMSTCTNHPSRYERVVKIIKSKL